MKTKSVVKYIISENKTALMIFYGTILMVLAFACISYKASSMFGGQWNFKVSGTELASVVFIFILGLNSFKQNFLFLSSNGMSRKTQFKGFLLSIVFIAAIFALMDSIYGVILSKGINYEPMFYQLYDSWVGKSSNIITIITIFIWSLALYINAATLGYFITNLYYKMSKIMKIVVTVGVIALFNLIPGIDYSVFGGKFIIWLQDTLNLLGGFNANGVNPYIAVLSLTVASGIWCALSFLQMRRAVVK